MAANLFLIVGDELFNIQGDRLFSNGGDNAFMISVPDYQQDILSLYNPYSTSNVASNVSVPVNTAAFSVNLEMQTVAQLNYSNRTGIVANIANGGGMGQTQLFSSRLWCNSGCERCEPDTWSEPMPCGTIGPDGKPQPSCPRCPSDPTNTVPCP